MKRYILITGILTVCAWLLNSCQEDLGAGTDNDKGVLTIQLNSMAATRADGPIAGIEDLNENLLKQADVFFFDENGGSQLYYEEKVSVENNTLLLMLPAEVEGKNCKIGIIANYGGFSKTDVEGKSWAELQKLQITTAFKNNDTKEEQFVMQGISDKAYPLASGTTVGPIELKRVAAKISLYPQIPEEIIRDGLEIDGVTYKPLLGRMSVSMQNVVKKASVDGITYAPGSDDFTTAQRTYKRGGDHTGDSDAYSHLPLYTYPNDWTTGKEEQESYLRLCIPWTYTRNGVTSATDYFYRVAIGGDNKIKSNAFYRITVNVSILGSVDPDNLTPVEGKFLIKDWTTQKIDADMNRYEYLVLETNSVTLNNEDEATIYLATSSAASAKVVKVSYPDYSRVNSTVTTITNPSQLTDYEVDVFGQTLVFRHEVDPEAFTPQTIEIEVTNEDGKKETLMIVQYPPIYIVAENNQANGGNNRFVYGVKKNGAEVYDDRNSSLGGVYSYNYSTGSNSNPNQYTIYISALDVNDKYLIGDPRQESPTKLSNLNNKNGGLQSYMPTQDDNGNTNLVIAPAFKIASSWGMTTGGSYTQMQRRCASYQENGYPAGRWRLPTESEIEYIVKLSDQRKIPELFDGEYFAASGRVYKTSTSGGSFSKNPDKNSEHAVRCVYDVWYWGNDKIPNPNVFTWGDTDPIRPSN